jgi:hypothetical protein
LADNYKNFMKTQTPSRLTLGKLLAVAATCLAIQSTQATLLFQDGFNYPAGNLNATTVSPAGLSGNAWSSGSSHITVGTGNLTYSGLLDLGGNEVSNTWGIAAGSVYNTYANQSGVGNSVYYSFLIDCTTLPAATNYITSLNPGTTAPGGSGDALSVYVGGNGTTYSIGVRSDGSSTKLASTTLSLNTTYFIVTEYTFGASGFGTANLYIDPTPGGTQPGTPDATVNNTTAVTAIDDLGFKAQSTAGGFLLDSTTIGTTWADVTTAAPEPSTLALAGLGLLGLAARFRRSRG